MIYLAAIIVVAGLLTVRWVRLQARTAEMTALVEGMSMQEAQAEYDRCREQLSIRLAKRAAQSAFVWKPSKFPRRIDPGLGLDIDTLAERGAWMMDRIRGLDGAQTGPAPRIRAKMDLMDAAAHDAQGGGKQD